MSMPQAPTFAPPPAPPKKRRWGLIIAAAVAGAVVLFVAFIVGVFLLVNNSTADAQKVSDQFAVALQHGDGAKAYALGGPSLRAAATQEQINELAHDMATIATKAKVSPNAKAISASTENGKIAVFTYKLRSYQATPIYWKIEVKQEDGGWKIFNFRSSTK